MNIYSEYIHKVRKEKKVSRRELADAIGCSERAIEYWETSKRMPRIDLYSKALEYLDASYTLGKEK